MKKQCFFITGTDTDAGKTFVSTGLLAAAKRSALRTIGLKPVAAGAVYMQEKWRNEDALFLMEQTTAKLEYEQINPVLFKESIAPHIAAIRESKSMTVERLVGFVKGALLVPHDLGLIEGAGGWRVPLNEREMLSDLSVALGYPVIIVVNMKLGCINHAVLTAEAIRNDGLMIAGWVANFAEEMPCYQENLETLMQLLPAPMLGEVKCYTNLDVSFTVFDRILAKLTTLSE